MKEKNNLPSSRLGTTEKQIETIKNRKFTEFGLGGLEKSDVPNRDIIINHRDYFLPSCCPCRDIWRAQSITDQNVRS